MLRTLLAAALLVAAALSAAAQDATPPAANAAEPAVTRTVIDDDRARIEELRVRGELRSVKVTPKNGAKPYEILVGPGGGAVSDGKASSRGATGQRVWNVLQF
jgi:Protein of unknown function (DUF2782)